jgi:beta-glucosidase
VARLALEWIDACQAEGVLACAKHFPGIGRSTGRSDDELHAIAADRETMHASDLVPFRGVAERGVGSMMMSSVAYAGLDPGRLPAAQSREIVTWLLRQQLRFEGLLVAIAARTAGTRGSAASEEEAAVRAIAAGCDVILAPTDVRATVRALDAALAARSLDPARVQESTRRRLRWAQWVSPPNDWRRPSAADAAWGAQLADRVVHVTRGAPPALGREVEVAVVDDDALDVADAPPRDALLDTLRAGGREVRDLGSASAAGDAAGPLLVALYGEAQPGRKHVGYAPASRERVAALCASARARGRGAVVLQFAHPRLLVELPEVQHAVCAWSGDRGMQQAAGRWLAARA